MDPDSEKTQLREMATTMERFEDVGAIVARTLWIGLVAGRWCIVDHFDRDGRRWLVATRNEVANRSRALSSRQAEVVARAASGQSLKVVAGQLTLSTSTVSAHLSCGMRKLGVKNRIELVRVIGSIVTAASGVSA
ncbi:MAG: helix-turn-helix transcriptional regulator [Polyangiales bacterium]